MKDKVSSIIGLFAAILAVITAFSTDWQEIETLKDTIDKSTPIIIELIVAIYGFFTGRTQNLKTKHQ